MSEAATSNENVVQPAFLKNEGEGAGPGSSQVPDIPPAAGGVEAVPENQRSPPIQAAAPSQNEEKPPPENVLNENLLQLELLRILTRGFPENGPKPTPSEDKEIKALRRKFFGLTKTEPGVNNQFDYEQKYPEDQPGEELAPNARVWLTYLDEAETYDRERVEGWKETADVLLVFAGLFSGVITTFLSQASGSQSLQRDNTQVSAFLLFEIAQLLRAPSSGTPINNIPNSTLSPTSPFTPSTNAFLVNGLWFTSLAITLSTALFAVLSKQWLYYYLSSISGTPREKARARQFRLQGFELWKVGAIIDLLPILLHLAVGIFLTGIIILLFPLDVRVAWTIVAITGATYVLYFVSVILPIRYPGCPYTTSLTIYIGVLFFFLPKIFHWISAVSKKVLHSETSTKQVSQPGPEMRPRTGSEWTFFWEIISFSFHPVWRFLRYSYVLVPRAFSAVNRLVHPMLTALGHFASTIPKFTDWREEKIKKAVTSAAALDSKALYWLYKTSSATSVHRIIARCAFIHGNVTPRLEPDVPVILEVNETNVVDFRYGLCVDILSRDAWNYWSLLPSIPDVDLEDKAEYQNYSLISKNVITEDYTQILKDACTDDTLELPVAMWQCFLARAPGDDTVAAHILTFGQTNLFYWNASDSIHSTDLVSLQTALDDDGSGKWKFDYLFRYFGHGSPDYPSEGKPFEIRHLLLVSVYRNLTSKQPLIADKEQRQQFLDDLFRKWGWLYSKHVSSEQYFASFINVCCADAFWSESMTDSSRRWAVCCLRKIWESMDTDVANRFPFAECNNLSLIYQWCSRSHNHNRMLTLYTASVFPLLVMPQNRPGLCTILLNDSDAVSHFSTCLKNFGNYNFENTGKNLNQSLMHLFMSVDTDGPLFTILYNSSVLLQLWRFLAIRGLNGKTFFSIVKSRLDSPQRLHDLYGHMIAEARSEEDTNRCSALEQSARQFGQSIGVAYSQHQPSESTEEKNHDSEERAQSEEPNENEHQNYSVFHRVKKVIPFGPR